MMGKYTRFMLPPLLALLAIWLLFCTHLAGIVPVKEILCRIAIPTIVFMVSAVIFSLSGHRGRTVFFILLCLITLFESVIGVLQLLELYPSRNPFHILTGHFINQGLYGALMSLTCTACLYEFVFQKNRSLKIAVATVFLISFVMMILSVSRAAWLGFGVAAFAIVRRETYYRIIFRRKLYLAAAIIVTAGICTSVFFIKPESALARFHIWRIDILTIMEHPLTGSGTLTEMGAYGDAQEHFFAAKQRPWKVKLLADSPQFAYNEFLQFGMQGGIPALLLSVSAYLLAVFLLLRKRNGSAYVLIALGVFSLFSFPLFSLTLSSVLALLLADASVSDGDEDWRLTAVAVTMVICLAFPALQRIEQILVRNEWVEEPADSRHYGKYYSKLKYDAEYMYLYGTKLYHKGYYTKALEILEEAAPLTSMSMLHCLIGHCQDLTGQVIDAPKSYKKAMNMVPGRLTPYYLMIMHYKSLGFASRAEPYKKEALAIPIDSTQSETVRVRQMIKDIKNK